MGAEFDEERDYDVDVKLKITFKNREFNCLLQLEMEEGIVEFLKAINGDYMIPESESIQFQGDEEVIAEYSFCCHDTSEAEAESFAKYIIHEAEHKFKEEGYTLEAESYHAQESDMSWLDEMERQIFG
ncbi:hypothetical protein [Hungatella effluvii]|uniref:hypothetical protein n=1 Tax=Hungatella effluvii TaxID=1096246 RepID=UPI0022E71B60|nr:hypothetical protein [Hungatella effluvii]